jgi:hypothetical protein
MKKVLFCVYFVAVALSLTACGLYFQKRGFVQGVQYCQLMPEICHGAEFVGDRFGA